MTSSAPTSPSPSVNLSESSGEMALEEILTRADGLLGTSGQSVPSRFIFEWKGIAFTVTTEQPEAAEGITRIEACLGRLPYTAEDAAARSSTFQLSDLDAEKAPGRLKFDKDSRVHLVLQSEPIRIDGLAGFLKVVACMVLESANRLQQLRGLLVD